MRRTERHEIDPRLRDDMKLARFLSAVLAAIVACLALDFLRM